MDELAAFRALLSFYAASGIALALVYQRLSPAAEVNAPRPPAARMGLHRSRRIVFEMAGLQSLDSLAGGFIVQSLLVYWFHLRFGVGPDALGALFFGTNLLSAVSFLVAARVAGRIGLRYAWSRAVAKQMAGLVARTQLGSSWAGQFGSLAILSL